MQITLLQAFLIGVIYYFGFVGTPWFLLLGGISIVQKPLVAGVLVGIILGNPVQGAIVGAAVQMPFIAYI
ncbi:MAG: PTS sugar transporter subunit IIC, partial [Lancefieldella rimae]